MKFDPKKDYYGVLGVTSCAEAAVIKAAYKALAGIYHPDKNGSQDTVEKMKSINEAWDVLSDVSSRKKYDAARGDVNEGSDIFGNDKCAASDGEFENDWVLAMSYYPDLKNMGERLTKISWRLSVAFKAHLLESKNFKDREKIATNMEEEFLKSYFGRNKEILSLARKLIFVHPDRKLLRELNKAVTTLGLSDPETIIKRFGNVIKEIEIEAIARDSYDLMQTRLRPKGHILSRPLFGSGYKVIQPSGEEIRLENWWDLQSYYDEHG